MTAAARRVASARRNVAAVDLVYGTIEAAMRDLLAAHPDDGLIADYATREVEKAREMRDEMHRDLAARLADADEAAR